MAVWWVNQRHTFDQELAAGILWAPKADRNGHRKSHWNTMTEVRPGDTVIHYASKAVVAVSVVTAAAVDARRPMDLPDDWDRDGRLVEAVYRRATRPVSLTEIPQQWRTGHSSPGGPFKRDGGVNQGYLFRVDDDFSDRFMHQFGDRFAGVSAALPAEANESATNVLRRLLGEELTTISGQRNRILEVQPPNVRVATSRSPEGKLIPIADVEAALARLQSRGSVTIHPDEVGYRSAFIGSVLLTFPGVELREGTPPVIAVRPPDAPDTPTQDQESLSYEGELDRPVTAAQRGEQARLRRRLFGSDTVAVCALCGDTFPVRFLVAAHIKMRSLCTDEERRDLAHIAMPACHFGCDALYETGYISVDQDGKVVAAAVENEDFLSARLLYLAGRACLSFTEGSRRYFAWHYDNRFRR
ncbi:hypothetical protein [Herbidospora daliensis]|uniref:hypothetical protein n=1 Tax=Herbidospora daliensis TaxID=295585 RepID=UPI000AEBFC65|nr:hypothetical protein [Herbidospora daliensis]